MLWLHSASRPNSPAKTRLSVCREELWLPELTRYTRELQSNSLRNLNNLSPFTFIRGRSLRIANFGLRIANLKARSQEPEARSQKAESVEHRARPCGLRAGGRQTQTFFRHGSPEQAEYAEIESAKGATVSKTRIA